MIETENAERDRDKDTQMESERHCERHCVEMRWCIYLKSFVQLS